MMNQIDPTVQLSVIYQTLILAAASLMGMPLFDSITWEISNGETQVGNKMEVDRLFSLVLKRLP